MPVYCAAKGIVFKNVEWTYLQKFLIMNQRFCGNVFLVMQKRF
jgi:hypothetical protein